MCAVCVACCGVVCVWYVCGVVGVVCVHMHAKVGRGLLLKYSIALGYVPLVQCEANNICKTLLWLMWKNSNVTGHWSCSTRHVGTSHKRSVR